MPGCNWALLGLGGRAAHASPPGSTDIVPGEWRDHKEQEKTGEELKAKHRDPRRRPLASPGPRALAISSPCTAPTADVLEARKGV